MFIKLFKLERIEKPIIYIFTVTIFIILNVIISTIGLRLDFSKGRAYTLSPSTKKITNKLDDVINIKFFVSSDLPTRLIPLKTEVIDLLNEYKKTGRNKIVIKVLDPKKDENALNEVKEYGVPELQFSQLEKDKYAVSSTYFGIVLQYLDKREIIPQASDIENLEYNLTSLIYKIARKEMPAIGIIGDNGSSNPQNEVIKIFKQIVSQQYNISEIDISEESTNKEIDQSIPLILVFDDDKKTYSDSEKLRFKNYVKKGGKIIFFVDGVWVQDNLTTNDAGHNLFSLFEDFGITLHKNLVLSTSSELVNFGNDVMQFLTPYPFWIKTNYFNSSLSYFSNITQLTYPWTSSLSITSKLNIEVKELVKTSNKSWEQKNQLGGLNLNPQNIPNPQNNNFKEYIISVQSKYKNLGEIIVIPSSRFILDQYLGRSSDNVEFVLNIVNSLASGGALSGIRSRNVSFYPLPDLTETQKDIFKYTNILILPILLGLYGGWRLLKRK